jgi:glycosyltransferase involved in cell wall biosynthesis
MAPLDEGLLEFFDVTLMQNLDSIGLAEGCHEKIVARIGGLILNGKTDPFRYDKQLAKVGAVIACNDELHGIGAHANANCTMIPNGVDLEQFKPAEVRGDRPFTVGFVGNIWGAQAANYKGWPFYVQAVEIELALENIDRRNLLHDLPEQKPHEEMPDYFQNIDCLVMPSEGEGCSNTIKEALACGVPVLCTKVGFHGERLTDGENVIFIQRDGKDIAAKILMLKNDAALQEKLRFNGRLFAENNHDIRVIANAYDAKENG